MFNSILFRYADLNMSLGSQSYNSTPRHSIDAILGLAEAAAQPHHQTPRKRAKHSHESDEQSIKDSQDNTG